MDNKTVRETVFACPYGARVFWVKKIWVENPGHCPFKYIGRYRGVPRTAGMKQRQLVSMAPFTTSSSGSTTKTRRASPTTCIDSNTQTTRKSEKEDRRQDLNTQMREDRNRVPEIKRFGISGKIMNRVPEIKIFVQRQRYEQSAWNKDFGSVQRQRYEQSDWNTVKTLGQLENY